MLGNARNSTISSAVRAAKINMDITGRKIWARTKRSPAWRRVPTNQLRCGRGCHNTFTPPVHRRLRPVDNCDLPKYHSPQSRYRWPIEIIAAFRIKENAASSGSRPNFEAEKEARVTVKVSEDGRTTKDYQCGTACLFCCLVLLLPLPYSPGRKTRIKYSIRTKNIPRQMMPKFQNMIRARHINRI